jgi:hypothetical protein
MWDPSTIASMRRSISPLPSASTVAPNLPSAITASSIRAWIVRSEAQTAAASSAAISRTARSLLSAPRGRRRRLRQDLSSAASAAAFGPGCDDALRERAQNLHLAG